MRNACPNCGFRDGIYWRPRHFDTNIEICEMEDFEKMTPSLAGILKEIEGYSGTKNFWVDGMYVYHVTKSGMVWRLEKVLWENFGRKFSTPSDGAGSSKSAKFKKAISKR